MATTKKQQHPLNSMHTSGIFSDMSIDGPEIGTLVMVVDKAKNLPNRKTIGKQDPYCAARLGKEAKKTTTDVRGGQTPKWDQELRFTVHDCADYYQLKVSVFNDDKKTDLIGETWIDLRTIVVPGGGQSDTWHTLNHRSKYAGEIRLEITYYDTRPKPEKLAPKPKAVASNADLRAAPPQQAAPPKRRPLPSEPPSGPAPSSAAPATPDHVQTPPRQQPSTPSSYIPKQSPLQTLEYSTPSPSARANPRSHHNSPAPVAAPTYNTTPQGHRASDKYTTRDEPEYGGQDDRSQYSSGYSQSHSQPHSQSRSRSFDRQASRSSFDADRDQFDNRGAPPVDTRRHPSIDEERPPPPPVHRSRGSSGSAIVAPFEAGQRGAPPTMRQDVLRSAHRQSLSSVPYPGRPTYRPYDSAPPGIPDDSGHHSSPPRHHSFDTYEGHQRSMQPTVEDDPDSPSAAANAFRSSGTRLSQTHFHAPYNEPDFDPVTPAPLHLSGRNGTSGAHSPSPAAPAATQHGRPQANGYGRDASPGRTQHNYITSSDPYNPREGSGAASPRDYHQRSPGPNEMVGHYHVSPGHSPQKEHHPVSEVPGPSSGRDHHYQSSPAPGSHTSYNNSSGNSRDEFDQRSPGFAALPSSVPASLVPGVDPSLALELSSRINDERREEMRREEVRREEMRREAMRREELRREELRREEEMRYEEEMRREEETRREEMRREEFRREEMRLEEMRREEMRRNSAMAIQTRGRQMIEYGYDGAHSSQAIVSAQPQHHRSFDDGQYHHGGNAVMAVSKHRSFDDGQYHHGGHSPVAVSNHRSISPHPGTPSQQHTIRRKSVSPAPPPADTGRRLSGMPFAPDSFDELNPTAVAVVKAERNKSMPDFNEVSGKIISHDGREVDPSDHLPMETWAPEPEPFEARQQKKKEDSPAGLPIGTSGRRQLRIAAVRSQGSTQVTYTGGSADMSTSPSAGRNRLQKKTHHPGSSAAPAYDSLSTSPSALMSSHHDDYTPPRALQRASTFDHFYEPEDQSHAPLVLYNGGRRGGHRHSTSGGPPIPAKIPMGSNGSPSHYRNVPDMDPRMPVMSGALPSSGPPVQWDGRNGRGGGGEDWALMEEMSRIDIGSGRARRHGGY